MNWQEADTELNQRVKKYRYDHPRTSYKEAMDIVLNDDSELAAAYSGVESPLKRNIKRQFELDRKLKENPNSPTADIDRYQYRVTTAEFLGWRSASKTYGVDVEREIIAKIQREIMDLENKKIQAQKIVSNYPEKEELRHIEAQLNELRKKLDKIKAGKKYSQKKRYPSPSAELADRAKKYSGEYGVDYETAVVEILEEDLVLSTAYNFYDIDTLLGLKG